MKEGGGGEGKCERERALEGYDTALDIEVDLFLIFGNTHVHPRELTNNCFFDRNSCVFHPP